VTAPHSLEFDHTLAILAFVESPSPQAVCNARSFVEVNHAFAHLFGYQRAELVGQSTRILYPSLADYQDIGQRCLAQLQRSCHYEDERFMQHRNGEVFWIRSRGITLTPAEPFKLIIWNFERIADTVKTVHLTRREREISSGVVNGLSCKEIAQRLGISYRTVEIHRSRIMRKLNVKNTAEMVSHIIMLERKF